MEGCYGFEERGDEEGIAIVIEIDEPLGIRDRETKSNPGELLKVAWDGVERSSKVPKRDEGDVVDIVCGIDTIDDVVEGHCGA